MERIRIPKTRKGKTLMRATMPVGARPLDEGERIHFIAQNKWHADLWAYDFGIWKPYKSGFSPVYTYCTTRPLNWWKHDPEAVTREKKGAV